MWAKSTGGDKTHSLVDTSSVTVSLGSKGHIEQGVFSIKARNFVLFVKKTFYGTFHFPYSNMPEHGAISLVYS